LAQRFSCARASRFISNFICEYFLNTSEFPCRSNGTTHSSATPPALRRVAERTEYAVKFISDTYYARVSNVRATKSGVTDYKTLVGEKLKTAGDLHEFRVDQFNERRMFALEVVVAILVQLDVIALLRGK
jgi:hypothetical protein